MPHALRGLYVITRPLPGGANALALAVEQAIAGGAAMVQYRDKSASATRRLQHARVVLEACRAGGVPLVVNDDPALAREVGADGVHLGSSDAGVGEARALLGDDAIIGVSCYNELDRALRAEMEGASYAAFGSFFPSPTKPNAVRARPSLLEAARERIGLPICAIGGITPDNGGELVAAGADLLAVLSGVFEAVDVREAAQAYGALFKGINEERGVAH